MRSNPVVHFKYILWCIVCISNGSQSIIYFIVAHLICIYCNSCPCLCPSWRNKMYSLILFIHNFSPTTLVLLTPTEPYLLSSFFLSIRTLITSYLQCQLYYMINFYHLCAPIKVTFMLHSNPCPSHPQLYTMPTIIITFHPYVTPIKVNQNFDSWLCNCSPHLVVRSCTLHTCHFLLKTDDCVETSNMNVFKATDLLTHYKISYRSELLSLCYYFSIYIVTFHHLSGFIRLLVKFYFYSTMKF